MKYHHVFGFLAGFVFSLILFTGCDDNVPSTGLPSNNATGDPVVGWELYSGQRAITNPAAPYACITCHGGDTLQVLPPAHSLKNVRNRGIWWVGLDSASVVFSLREAVNVCLTNWMQSDPLQAEQETWEHLDAYLDSISTGTGGFIIHIDTDSMNIDPIIADPHDGDLAYREACEPCHGDVITGNGGYLPAPLTLEDWLRRDLLTVVRTSGLPVEFGRSEPVSMLKMPFIASSRLSNETVNTIQSYVADTLYRYDPDHYETLIMENPAVGNTDPQTTHNYACATCHDLEPPPSREDPTRFIYPGGNLHNVADSSGWWVSNLWDFDQTTLKGAINLCVEKWMAGDPLPNYKAYETYLRHLTSDLEASNPSPSERYLTTFTGADATNGRHIYDRSCVGCHGSAEGDAIPPLPNIPTALFTDYNTIEAYPALVQWVRYAGTGLSEMAAVNQADMPYYGVQVLRDDDLRDLIYYLVHVVNGGPEPE
ncbi:MAG: hypothetical protein D6675_10250 [Gemmatimonadetes bacterium]|nr:MAG: hypothetical protein D6675_10250 [Gemmatimonadota bacterium]